MTDIVRDPKTSRRSPRAVRNATFSRKVRGIDEIEVRDFLSSLADEIEAADSERAALRAEVDRLRAQGPGEDKRAEINAHAVALFSQAQQVADRLVEEAVQHARELMSTAREQQREILEKAHSAAEAAADAARAEAAAGGAARGAGGAAAYGATHGGGPEGQAYGVPIPEIEYVRTFAHVAQVQLRSVLDALTEQVDKLGQLPTLADSSCPAGSGGPAGHGAGPAGAGGGTGGVGYGGSGFASTPDYGDPLAGPSFPRELSSGPAAAYEPTGLGGSGAASDELWWQTDDSAS